MQDEVVGLPLAGHHEEFVLLAPLLQPLDALQHQVIPLYDLLDDFVFQFLGFVVDIHQVQLEPLLAVEQDQPFDFCVLDEVQYCVV